jgi:hypothetical protein
MSVPARIPALLSLVLVALLTLALVACGNDDDSDPAPPAPNGTPTETPSDDGDDDDANGDDADDNVDTDRPTPDDSDAGNGDDNGDDTARAIEAIRRAAEAREQRTLSVTYDIDWGMGTLTIETNSDPPRYSVAMSGDFGEGFGSFVSIYDGTDNYLCTEEEGVGTCLSFPGDASDFLDDDLFFFLQSEEILGEIAEEEGATIRQVQGRTIAGLQAECYEVSSPEGDGVICISPAMDAVLLIEGTLEDETFRMEVTSISDRPDPSSFEPPYPVIDFG